MKEKRKLIEYWGDSIGSLAVWCIGHFIMDGVLIIPGWLLIIFFAILVLYHTVKLFINGRKENDGFAMRLSVCSLINLILYVGCVTALSYPSIINLLN